MKNIQVIDGAINATYDIWSISDELFYLLFPNKGQNIEFIEDFTDRVWSNISENERAHLYAEWWSNPIPKEIVHGIHGTLFYELKDVKGSFYPNRKESDLNESGRIGWDHP